MTHKPPLLPGGYYHIFNRGLNNTLIFQTDEDFVHFIELMRIYLVPIAEIYSYALMSNHFHIAIRIKEDDEIGWLIPENAQQNDLALKWATTFDVVKPSSTQRKPEPDKMIRHMLNAYAKWFNVRQKRNGKLFEERHERRPIGLNKDWKQVILYINRNPEKHNVVSSFTEYPWTSYHALVSGSPSWISVQRVGELFDGMENFVLAMKKNRTR